MGAFYRPDTQYTVDPRLVSRRVRKRHGRKYRATKGVNRIEREIWKAKYRKRELEARIA